MTKNVTMPKKLAMIEEDSFHKLLTMMTKSHEDNLVLQNAINTPERVSLLESQKEMLKAVKSNSPRAAKSKVQFLKK